MGLVKDVERHPQAKAAMQVPEKREKFTVEQGPGPLPGQIAETINYIINGQSKFRFVNTKRAGRDDMRNGFLALT